MTTSVWTDGATYGISRNGNDFIATGVIPYGSADSLFPTAGNRFAIKISRDGITSKSQLPSGTIVKTTHTEHQGGYATGTKSDFEDDGSLVAIIAPTEETKDAYLREVKIKWKSGEDFTTYTFDLSQTTLMPLMKGSVGDSVSACKFNGDITKAEFIKLADEAWAVGINDEAYTENDGVPLIKVTGTVAGSPLTNYGILWLQKSGSNYLLNLAGGTSATTTIYNTASGYSDDFVNASLGITWTKSTYTFEVIATHSLEISAINSVMNGWIYGNVQ